MVTIKAATRVDPKLRTIDQAVDDLEQFLVRRRVTRAVHGAHLGHYLVEGDADLERHDRLLGRHLHLPLITLQRVQSIGHWLCAREGCCRFEHGLHSLRLPAESGAEHKPATGCEKADPADGTQDDKASGGRTAACGRRVKREGRVGAESTEGATQAATRSASRIRAILVAGILRDAASA